MSGCRGLRVGYWLCLSMLLGLLTACGGGKNGGDGDDDVKKVITAITGMVSGSGPILNVEVSAGGVMGKTDDNGLFLLENVPLPDSGQLVLTYRKAGFATYQRRIQVRDRGRYHVSAKLLQYHHTDQYDFSTAQNITVSDPDNVQLPPIVLLEVPQGAVTATGAVTVNVATGDPTTEAGRAVFPGDFMAAEGDDSEPDTPLESIAYTEITMNEGATPITTFNTPATVKVKLPDAYQLGGDREGVFDPADDNKNEIEWWSYDETQAVWLLEDADPATAGVIDKAKIIAIGQTLYAEAKVTHLSWWNADRPVSQHACVCLQVHDENEQPLQNAMVHAEGVTYDGVSSYVLSDAQGQACVTIKRSLQEQLQQRERVRVMVNAGDLAFQYRITEENQNEGVVDTGELYSPTQLGSTIRNTGQCVNLQKTLVLRFDGEVSGTVTLEGTGEARPGMTVYTSYGEQTTTDSQGRYSFSTPVQTPFTLFIPGLASETVFIDNADVPETVNLVVPNRAPVIDKIDGIPEGRIENDATVVLTATAHDPDGDAFTYHWEIVSGDAKLATTENTATFTSFETGAGTSSLRLTVKDDKGAESSQLVVIVWGGGPSATLKIHFKDDFNSEQSLAGVVVSLYNEDNLTINKTLVSEPSGVVDFGVVGRLAATFTIAYQDAYGNTTVQSFIEAPTGEYTYYAQAGTAECIDSLPEIDVTVPDIPVGALVEVQPFGNLLSSSSPTGEMWPVECYQRQRNGKMSLVALSGTSGVLERYGSLLEQDIVDGNAYTVPLTTDAGSIGWTTTPSTPEGVFSVDSYRNGVYYELLPLLVSPAITGAQGNTPFPDELDMDYFDIYHGSPLNFGRDFVLVQKRYPAALPATVNFEYPDKFEVLDLAYNDTTSTYSWIVTGFRDVNILNIEYLSEGEGSPFSWEIFMDPGKQGVTLPALPEEVLAWKQDVDDNLGLYGVFAIQHQMITMDVDTASGYAGIWALFTSGRGIDEPDVFNTFAATSDSFMESLFLAKPLGKTEPATSRPPLRFQDVLKPWQRR